MAQQHLRGGEGLGAVLVQAVEGAGLGEVLELPLVEALEIEAAREIEEIA